MQKEEANGKYLKLYKDLTLFGTKYLENCEEKGGNWSMTQSELEQQ